MWSKSKEIKELVINVVINKTLTPQKATEIFGVFISTIYFWGAIYKKTGSYKAKHPKEKNKNLLMNFGKNSANLLKKIMI